MLAHRSAFASLYVVGALLLTACSGEPRSDPVPTAGAKPAAATAAALAPSKLAEPLYRVPVDGLPASGDARAPVTIVTFTDYQCPYCRRVDQTIAKIRAAHGADVRVVLAERPLPIHEHARPAALAALAAAEQGKLDEMHARLFAETGALDDAAIARAAQDVGLDMARFDADCQSAKIAAALARSEQLADKLDVRGTPSFFINGRRVVGAQPLEAFESVITERLAAARALVASGVDPRSVYDTTIAGAAEHVAEEGAHACTGDGGCAANCDKHDDTPAVGAAVERVPTDGAPSRGALSAPITVVAFGDFQCPFSARGASILESFEKAHQGEVRVVWKNLPLPMHDAARPAAKAALAAEAQGHFWEYHDALFAHQKALNRASLVKYAEAVGLDVARFTKDLDDPALEARVAADAADAEALKVKGTPTFFVNGHRVVGAQPLATLEAAAASR